MIGIKVEILKVACVNVKNEMIQRSLILKQKQILSRFYIKIRTLSKA